MENMNESLFRGPLKYLEVKNNIKAYFSIFHDLKYRFEDTPKRLRVYLKHDELTNLSVAGLIKFYYKKIEGIDIKFIYNRKEKCIKFPLEQNITFTDPKRSNYYGIYEPDNFDEDESKEIRLSEFLKNCRLDIEFLVNLAQFPEDFTFFKNQSGKQIIYYYSFQGLETFYM